MDQRVHRVVVNGSACSQSGCEWIGVFIEWL